MRWFIGQKSVWQWHSSLTSPKTVGNHDISWYIVINHDKSWYIVIYHDMIRQVDLIKSDIVLICIAESNREMQMYCILLDKNAVFTRWIHPYEELSDIIRSYHDKSWSYCTFMSFSEFNVNFQCSEFTW